nr:patatin-like protein [Saccharopolyspora sp. HNM0983]
MALAMRGGASMAVWIGGAVSEVDRLRSALRAPEPSAEQPAAAVPAGKSGDRPDRHPWAELARLAGYDSVALDVLAGASAGGLNATLLSASMVYGFDFAQMRELWIRLADVEAMSRPIPRFWQPAPPSLFEGDDYFRRELVELLTSSGAGNTEQPDRRIELLLTATLLDPLLEQRFDARAGRMVQQRRKALFRFRHRGRAGHVLSDFGDGERFAESVLRLAHAARSTSSYPFAFEPARVHSAHRAVRAGEPDMTGIFSETAPEGKPPDFRVIDGGVLDNIPVEAAVRAIGGAPADRPTRRWLLYLNPDPAVSRDQRKPGRALPVTGTAVQARMSQESLLDDIDALVEHNRVVERSGLRRRSLFAPLHAAAEADRENLLGRQAAASEQDNAVVRAELDAQAVHRLLTEPAANGDGQLLGPVEGDPLAGWSPRARTLLEQRLSEEFARSAGPHVFDDVRGFLSAVQECLWWAWDVEGSADRGELGACKAALYRLRTLGEVIEGCADAYWTGGARLEPIVEPAELGAWVQRVLLRRDRLQHALPSPIGPLLGEVLAAVDDEHRFQEALGGFTAELSSMVESSGADAVPHADGVDAIALARTELHRVADRLARAAPHRADIAQPEQVGFWLLERTGRRGEVLRRLVVLTAPLDVGRAPGSRIDLLRVVSDEQSPLPFTALRGADDRLRIEDKVRGSDLGNFGAFLSAKWRANDWMWGRLDAAAGLVELLADGQRWVQRHAGADELGDELQAVVCRPSTAELGGLDEQRLRQWRTFLAELWSRYAGEVRAELDGLFAAPEDEHPLTATRRMLTERLQWTIAAAEIPYVAQVSPGADPQAGDAAAAEAPAPEQVAEQVRAYDVGAQRFGDLGERRALGLATRLGLVGYRAARPTGRGLLPLLGRAALVVAKPLALLLAFAVAAPTRAAVLGLAAAGTAAFAGAGKLGLHTMFFAPGAAAEAWASMPPAQPDGVQARVLFDFSGWPGGLGGALAAVLAVCCAVWLGARLARGAGSGLRRWIPALAVALVLLSAGYALALTGWRLGPPLVVGIAVLLTWSAATAWRTGTRLAASALTGVVFAAVLGAADAGLLSWPAEVLGAATGWIGVAALLTACLQTALLTAVDVLPPRPRGRRG